MGTEPPAGWRRARWGELIELHYGKALPPDAAPEGATLVYGTNGPTGRTTGVRQGTGPTVVVGRKGANRGVTWAPDAFWVIDTAFFTKAKDGVDLAWAYWAMSTLDIDGLDSGSAIPSTRRDDVYALTALVPPLEEQREIAATLTLVDEKIASNKRLSALAREAIRGIYHSWFIECRPARSRAGETISHAAPDEVIPLFPSAFEEIAGLSVPRGWTTGTLADLASITMGQSPPSKTYNDDGVGLPLIQGAADLGESFPEPSRFCSEPTRTGSSGCVLMTVRAPVGRLNTALEDVCLGRGVACIQSETPTYVRCLLERASWIEYESGTIFPAVNAQQVKSLPVVLPPREIRDAFESYCTPFEALILGLECESRHLRSLRQALVPALVSGRLRVSGAIDNGTQE